LPVFPAYKVVPAVILGKALLAVVARQTACSAVNVAFASIKLVVLAFWLEQALA
jgi:hypothetical protein